MSLVVEVGWVVDLDAEAVIDELRADLRSDRPLILSGAWSLSAAGHLIEQAAALVEVMVLLPYTAEAPRGLRPLSLGHNASFNPLKPMGDRSSYAIFIAEVLKGVFDLSNAQASTLKRALMRAYSSNKEPSIDDVVSALEIESAELASRDAVDLIEVIEAMERGRLGAACKEGPPLEPCSAVSMSELPPRYATAISMAILVHALRSGFRGVVAICDLDLLNAFLGPARSLAIDLLNRLDASGSTVMMCSGSASALPLELRSRARMSLMGLPLTAEDARGLSAVLGRRALRLLNSKERFAYKLEGSAGVVEVPLKETAKIAVGGAEPPLEAPRPALYAKLGGKAKMAYEVLSFLRDGPSTRDSAISYAMHRLEISSLEASRLINALLAHGLLNEVVGADGKYWLKITVRGLSAIEELEALEGWLARG